MVSIMGAKQSSTTSRQRATMVMISDMAARHVCFTKRRRGLFKKVCELSTLCGAHSLAFVTSTAGKLYSIGTPDVPTAVERFLGIYSGENAAAAEERPPESTDVGPDRQLLEKLHQEIGALEKRSDELRELRAVLLRSIEEKAGGLPHRWGEKLGDLPTQELEEMMASLGGFLARVGFDVPEAVGEWGAPLNHLVGAPAEAPAGSIFVGPMNVARPVRHLSTPQLPPLLSRRQQLINTSGLVASVRSSSPLVPPSGLLGFHPSPALAPALSWRPSSTVYSGTVLMTPSLMTENPLNPSGFRRLIPADLLPPTADHVNTFNSGDYSSRIAMTTTTTITTTTTSSVFPVPSSGSTLASANPPALCSFLPATPKPVNMSGVTSRFSAPSNPLGAPQNPSTFTTSPPLLPPPRHANQSAGRRTTPPAAYTWPVTAGAPQQHVANDGTAPEEAGQSINARGEGYAVTGDALPSSSAQPSLTFFDIPRDFDFVRDWTV